MQLFESRPGQFPVPELTNVCSSIDIYHRLCCQRAVLKRQTVRIKRDDGVSGRSLLDLPDSHFIVFGYASPHVVQLRHTATVLSLAGHAGQHF